jgi:hypothetical protein
MTFAPASNRSPVEQVLADGGRIELHPRDTVAEPERLERTGA